MYVDFGVRIWSSHSRFELKGNDFWHVFVSLSPSWLDGFSFWPFNYVVCVCHGLYMMCSLIIMLFILLMHQDFYSYGIILYAWFIVSDSENFGSCLDGPQKNCGPEKSKSAWLLSCFLMLWETGRIYIFFLFFSVLGNLTWMHIPVVGTMSTTNTMLKHLQFEMHPVTHYMLNP